MQKEANKAARRGARLLDALVPGWHTRISLGELDLGSGCNCICGQLARKVAREKLGLKTGEEKAFSEALLGLRRLAKRAKRRVETHYFGRWEGYEEGEDSTLNASYYGFDSGHSYSYADLDVAWRVEIMKRLSPGKG